MNYLYEPPNKSNTFSEFENSNKSECYKLFYMYFINLHDEEPKLCGIITDKQIAFQTTKMYIFDSANIESYSKEHLSLYSEYINKTKANKNTSIIIFGEPILSKNVLNINFPEQLSYSQYLFLLDIYNAYEDVKNVLDNVDRSKLEQEYEESMNEVKENLEKTRQTGFAIRSTNSNEVIVGLTRTKEEIKEQINYDAVNRANILGTISNYCKDDFYREIFNEMFPKNPEIIKVYYEMMNKAKVFIALDTFNNTKQYVKLKGQFDFDSFYKKFMEEAYKKLQEKIKSEKRALKSKTEDNTDQNEK